MSDYIIAYNGYQKLIDEEPNTYKEAIKSNKCKEWMSAMRDEVISFDKNQTQKLVSKLKDKSIVDVNGFTR